MTPEERNTVIEALEVSLSLIDQIDFETGTTVAAALAIMRREREPVAWINPTHTFVALSDKSTVYGSHTIPLYKD